MELVCISRSTPAFTKEGKGIAQPGWYKLTKERLQGLSVGAQITLVTPPYYFLDYQLVDLEVVEVAEFSFDGEFGYIKSSHGLYGVMIVD